MSASRLRLTLHAIAALVAAFVFAVAVTAGAAKWVPAGPAKIDNIIIPIVVFPIVWVTFALGLFAARRRGRAWAVVGAITGAHVALILRGFSS